MKKLIFLTLFILVCFILSGCTSEELYGYKLKNINDYKVCIDGIEYIMYADGYQGYMAPHLTADKLNNPKVIKCEY